jgi:phosphohistidine phosphatase SixA
MNIFLLRHGIAASRDPARFENDSLRPLTAHGEDQIRKISKAMRRLKLGVDGIWFSPYLRTRQTAAATAKELQLKDKLQQQEQLSPDGDPAKLLADLASLRPSPRSFLLVGHEPSLSRLLSVVASGTTGLMAELKKGGLAKLETNAPLGLHQCAVLQWLLPPRVLVQIGR